MQNKKVSVIMSVYNETENELKAAIDSILSQSFNDFEFIIVLDNPKNTVLCDMIRQYLKQDNRIIFLKNEENKGLPFSLNRALTKARGEYIARMDADDISYQNRLEKQINYIEATGMDLIYSGIEYIDESGKSLWKSDALGKSSRKCRNTIKYVNCSSHPTWFFRKKILDAVTGYNDIPFAEDYDFLCRVISSGHKACGMDEILLKYRMRSESFSNSNKVYQDIMSKCISEEYRKRFNRYSSKRVMEMYQKCIQDKKYCCFIQERYENGQEYKKCFRKRQYFQGMAIIIKSFFKHPSLVGEIYRKGYIKIINIL